MGSCWIQRGPAAPANCGEVNGNSVNQVSYHDEQAGGVIYNMIRPHRMDGLQMQAEAQTTTKRFHVCVPFTYVRMIHMFISSYRTHPINCFSYVRDNEKSAPRRPTEIICKTLARFFIIHQNRPRRPSNKFISFPPRMHADREPPPRRNTPFAPFLLGRTHTITIHTVHQQKRAIHTPPMKRCQQSCLSLDHTPQ